MAVLDLVACPICHARESLTRQTTQLESRTHVTYECLECGTLLVWLGDEMWLEADRWSFQKVGLPERAELLYRSMTVAELRKLAGDQSPYTAAPGEDTGRELPPPTWIEMAPAQEEPFEEALPEEYEGQAQPPAVQEPPPEAGVGAAVVGAAMLAQEDAQPEPEQELPPGAGAATAMVGAAALVQEDAQPVPEQGPLPEPTTEAEMEGPPVVAQEAEQAPEQPLAAQEPLAEAAVAASAVGAAALAQRAPSGAAEAADGALDDAPPPTQSRQQRRRGRGSPFLVISVGLVLLCLICSAAVMVIYSMWEKLPASVGPTANPPASEVQPTEGALPTDTPFSTPAEEAPPEAEEGVVFQGVTDYLSSTGSHYLVGEVVNQTGDTLRFVEVLATFFDADAQLVGTGSTFTELSVIEPDSTAPFKMTTMNPPSVGRYDLRVDYSTTTQPPIRLELAGHSGSASESGWYHVTGEVRNPHDFATKFPEIVATYYNATHQVVRVEVDFAQLDPLEPGQASPFEVILTDPPADLQHYALQTEAVQP